jgi:hypothetical protein
MLLYNITCSCAKLTTNQNDCHISYPDTSNKPDNRSNDQQEPLAAVPVTTNQNNCHILSPNTTNKPDNRSNDQQEPLAAVPKRQPIRRNVIAHLQTYPTNQTEAMTNRSHTLHQDQDQHSISFNKTDTLTHTQYYCPQIIREATRLNKHMKVNCAEGYKMSNVQHTLFLQTFLVTSFLVSILSRGRTE